MTAAVNVWLVRHGQSKWNVQGRIQGHSGEGLSDMGHRQARATAEWLSASVATGMVVSSDLERAAQTAAPICDALAVEVGLDPALRERSFGDWEGALPADLSLDGTGLWDIWTRQAGDPNGERDVVVEVGGESNTAIAQRVVPALAAHVEAARTHGVGDVVVVSHGGIIWHGLHRLLGLPDQTLGAVGNASITNLRYAHGQVLLEGYNSQAHLPAAERTTFRPRELDRRG